MDKITYTNSRIEKNKVIIDVAEKLFHHQLVITLDPLVELLRVADIQSYYQSIDDLIYSNARLTNFLLNSDIDDLNKCFLGTSDNSLRYARDLSVALKEADPDLGLIKDK
ncbi:MAG: hypothetical protein AB2L24_18535 [Mangrovibacterium sp.]